MKIKTIDVHGLEWFDRINGNSYFAGNISINYGLKNRKDLKMPFQYGYGDSYLQESASVISKLIKKEITSLWRYCDDNGIILRASKKENCLLKELKNI